MISVVIPNHNGAGTIASCLEAVFASNCGPFEVVVVDDCSEDESREIIRRFPCRLISLQPHAGAARARNVGAAMSRGDLLFFTDADCLVAHDTLGRAAAAVRAHGPETIVGGTYAPRPADTGFYSFFQSIFINYHETKDCHSPDYIASHAMAIDRRTFEKGGGFPENFLPIIEDIEFSHRLRHGGFRLTMDPGIEVAHLFNFTLARSLKNAFRKSFWWTMYSLENGDLLSDSGTASRGLKVNVLSLTLCAAALAAALISRSAAPAAAAVAMLGGSVLANAGLIGAFFREGGKSFGVKALLYYFSLYPIAVGAGGLCGASGGVWRTIRNIARMTWYFQRSGMPER